MPKGNKMRYAKLSILGKRDGCQSQASWLENIENWTLAGQAEKEEKLLRERVIAGIKKYKAKAAQAEPKCAAEGCECKAAFNEYYPNSEGGQYWSLCEKCYEADQEE